MATERNPESGRFHSETQIDKAYGFIKKIVWNSSIVPVDEKLDVVHDVILKLAEENKMINYSYVKKAVENHLSDYRKAQKPDKKYSVKTLPTSFFIELEKASNLEDTTQIHELAPCDVCSIREIIGEDKIEEMIAIFSDKVDEVAKEQGVTTQAIYQRRDRLIKFARNRLKIK